MSNKCLTAEQTEHTWGSRFSQVKYSKIKTAATCKLIVKTNLL